MKTFFRKHIVEIISFSVFLAMLIAFSPVASPNPYPDFDEDSDIQLIIAREISSAYARYNHAIDENFTDMDCQIASQKLADEIDSILFFYRDEIMEVIGEQDLEEYQLEERQSLMEDYENEILDSYGASMDSRQFND